MKVYRYSLRYQSQENRIPALVREGRALYKIYPDSRETDIHSASDLPVWLNEHLQLGLMPEEYVYILAVNTHLTPIGVFELSHGTVSMSPISPREVFTRLLMMGACGFFMAHNHPSGRLDPSRGDWEVTKKLIEAGKIMGVPLEDHFLIGGTKYFSFRYEKPELWKGGKTMRRISPEEETTINHIMGNTPRCDECYFYTAKSEREKDNWLDGWCRQENMVKNWQQHERMKTSANGRCRFWEDAEDRLTYHEVMTRSPEAWRSDIEKCITEKMIEEDKQ